MRSYAAPSASFKRQAEGAPCQPYHPLNKHDSWLSMSYFASDPNHMLRPLPSGSFTLPLMPQLPPRLGLSPNHNTLSPPLVTLATKIRQSAEAVCQHLSEQPHSHRLCYTLRNRNFYHIESIESAYIMHIIQGLQQVLPQCSLVLLHDGLLVSALPSQSTLTRLHTEALHLVGLQSDDTPFLLITNHRDTYTQLVQQLPPPTPHSLQALSSAVAAVNLSHLRQASTPRNTGAQHHADPHNCSYP